MTRNKDRAHSDILYETILELKDLDECKKFFSDLCTVAELRAMEQRFEVALLLSDGMIYNAILERTGASSATISRVNRSLQYGADGYQTVLPRFSILDGKCAELELLPVDLGLDGPKWEKGVPRLADARAAEEICAYLNRVSAPYGTRWRVQGQAIVQTEGGKA